MEQLSPLLEILVAHADRWCAACLVANENELKKSLTKAKGRFGQLHSLQISNIGYSNPGTFSDIFQDAPNLTRIWTDDHYQPPWSTLAALHVDVSRFTHRFFENLHKLTGLEELVINGFHIRPNVANTSLIKLPSLRMLSVDHFPPRLHIKAPVLERLYLGAVRAGLPTSTTLLRGVDNLKTLSFHIDIDSKHNAQVIEWTPGLDHLILSCGKDLMSLEAFGSLLQSLASHSTAYSLTKISVGDPALLYPGPSISIMHVLSTVIKSWEKHQFPKLRFVSVHINDDHSEVIASAIAALMRVGADKGFEIDANSRPLSTKLQFW